MSKNNEIVAADDEQMTLDIPKGYICTLDMDTEDGKVGVANALNGAESSKDYVDKPINITGVITTPGVRSQSGDDCTNTYLQLDDGKVIMSQSSGIANSIQVIVALWADKLAAGEPVRVCIKEKKINNGNTLKTVVPA